VLFGAMLALLVAAQQRGWMERFDLFLLDVESQINTPAIDPAIMLVEIDDASLEQIGAWPWDRGVHARLIDTLSAYGPRAIAYDVLFVEPGASESDAALAEALSANGKVILPHSFGPKLNTINGEVPIYPLDILREQAVRVGHVALVPDEDGVARRFELARKNDGESFPHFTVATLEVADSLPWVAGAGPETAIVRYGSQGAIRSISAQAVLAGSAPAEFFEDKVVFVGATSPGLGDRYSVPAHAGRILTGVEMQGHLASAILGGDLVQRAATPWTLGAQVLAIVVLFASFWRLSPRSALIIALGLVAGLFAASFLSLMVFNIWLPVGGALLAIVISYPLWGWRRLASVSRFLESEAAALKGLASLPDGERTEGFDVVAQQVALLKGLTKGVSGNLTLIQDVINASPDAMLVTDGDGAISMGNFAAQDLFGPISEVQGRELTDILTAAEGKLDRTNDELSLGDGRAFWLAAADLDPDVGSQVLSLREVTEIKEAERQRRETLEFLSHDMRSPQVAIISLTKQSDGALQANDRFKRIEDQARRTLKLTEDFVQIARIANEGVEREETEMNSVLQEAADRAFPLAHRKKMRVIFEPGIDPIFATVDAFAIARMLDNLISNAIKFSPEGSQVTLELEADEDRGFVIAVADEGSGLSPERSADPFARFGARDSSAGPSSGLGLAYVKQVVDLHHGAVSIETGLGEGTRFLIKIPNH
jgi:CHASE2 domain-containing sensor protein/two-component sensor histidine kinase